MLNHVKIPTVIILLSSIFFYFVDFYKFKSNIYSYISIFFEKKVRLLLSSIFLILLLVSSIFLNLNFTPAKWKGFIDIDFLSGAQNDYSKAESTIDLLEGNKSAQLIIKDCVKIFQIKKNVVVDRTNVSLDEIRKIISGLVRVENNNPYLRALMQFSVAEGMSILGLHDNSISYYHSFLKNKRKIKTDKWVESANLNIGNVYYYQGQYEKAINTWSRIKKTPSSLTNISVAYTMLKKHNKALDCINLGFEMMSPNQELFPNDFNNLVSNKIVVYTANDMIEDAISTYELADKIVPLDKDVKSEIVLLYILCDKSTIANSKIDSLNNLNLVSNFKYNLYKGLISIVQKQDVQSDKYLIKAFNIGEETSKKEIKRLLIQHFKTNGYSGSKKLLQLINMLDSTMPNK